GFTVKLTDWLDGDGAGIKSATVMVEGINAYGYLKSENGVHRLVRVSPFDAAGRRQTSFASIEVMPEFANVDQVVIRDEDIEVTAHRSSGAGGQHINKTDSAIRILHKPTGIVVGCQTERSQLQNKETAMKMLKAKLMEIKLRERLDTIEEIQGNKVNIEWGSQIRSYVFMPYTLAKDTRTGFENGNIDSVMDGNIDGFINAYLKMNAK
ncbi:MAG: PCRF domain-containing protein, partial [Clostridia bacterium]|nr:PCRF domain-containing protein [Clostridia bacterium]